MNPFFILRDSIPVACAEVMDRFHQSIDFTVTCLTNAKFKLTGSQKSFKAVTRKICIVHEDLLSMIKGHTATKTINFRSLAVCHLFSLSYFFFFFKYQIITKSENCLYLHMRYRL